MPEHALKTDDLEPPLNVVLLNGTTPADLTTAVSATFRMSGLTGLKIHAPATIGDQATHPGLVTYHWSAGDTDTAGTYRAEIRILWPGGRQQTYPGADYLTITIRPDLA